MTTTTTTSTTFALIKMPFNKIPIRQTSIFVDFLAVSVGLFLFLGASILCVAD